MRNGPLLRLADGFRNIVTGAGTGRDHRTHNRYFVRPLADEEIEAAYRSSWVMRRIIDKPAEEMVREWRDWQTDDEQIARLEEAERKLDLRQKVMRAEQLRGLGGGAMVLWIDGDDPQQPVDPARIRPGALRAVHVWHRTHFQLGQLIEDWTDPWFGHPSFYELYLRGHRAGRWRFHPSRVIAFRGKSLVGLHTVASLEDLWWGDSVVRTVLDAVQNVDESHNSFAALIKDARNRRVGIPNLTDIISTEEGENLMRRRMEALALGESMFGVTFYDAGDGEGKGGETIDDRQINWSGIPDMMRAYLAAAAAAADMPATVLLGKSPDGMNATGDSDLKIWQQTVKARQDLQLRPCLDQLDAVLIPSAIGKPASEVWWEFAPLSTPTEKESAETFKMVADAINTLRNTGTVPDEALTEATQNLLVERGWLTGLDQALAKIPEDERFGITPAPAELADNPADLVMGEGRPAPSISSER